MDQEIRIINTKGKHWKHRVLSGIASSREFPTRLRLFNLTKKLFGLDLLLSKTPSGLTLLLDISDWVQYQIYFYGNYEGKSITLFKDLSKNASVVFDIGAHVGQYALECAQDDKEQTKQIFALEVNPKTFAYLLNNIQINKFKNVTAVLGAVGTTPDIYNINIPAYWNMGNTQIDEHSNHTGLDNYLVASFSIPALLKKCSLPHVDLIKIDIEGHELGVFQNLFSENIYPENIIFEFIPDVFEQANELVQLLRQHNYTLKDMDGNLYAGQTSVPEQNLWAQRA
ncbi:MAG TPA: FkbM family methyltransferase [Mucilaginibacter sp.]